jgi:hypothetical protein
MSNLPPIHFPPPKNKKQAGQQNAFRSYINAHPALRPWAQQLYKSATNYGLDPVYFASLVNFESGGKANAKSGAGAYGLAQIHVPTWLGKTDPRTGQKITQADINNPTWNLGFGAYLFSQALHKYGSYQAAYRQGYNPGYTGSGPFGDLPKGYVPTGTAQSPQDAAARSVETSNARQDLTDPFVTIRNGKLVKATQRNALKIFGQPVRRSQVLSTWQNLNDLYLAYTGRPVTLRAVKDILASGKSRYQVIDILSKGPHFVGSPVWKQNAPGYEAVWKSIYGQDSNPDANAIKYAIVNNLGGEGFASTLRSRPDYENSQEFKGNEATLSSVYTKVYGVPDVNGNATIRQATKQGQSPDEFASWLRAQPEYQYSSEFKSRTLGVAQALGFVTGQMPTLGAGLTSTALPIDPTTPGPKPAPAGVIG